LAVDWLEACKGCGRRGGGCTDLEFVDHHNARGLEVEDDRKIAEYYS